MKLLIIEDEKKARVGLYNLICRNFPGLNVLEPACCGREGLKVIENEAPDIILTDIRMPDLDGLEMLKLLPRRMPAPFIAVISGYSDFEYARRSIQLGVQEYLLKPFTVESLNALVDKAIDRVRSSYSLHSLMGSSGEAEEAGVAETSSDRSSGGCQFLFRYSADANEDELFAFLRKNLIRLVVKGEGIEEFSDPSAGILSFFIPLESTEDFSCSGELIRRIGQNYSDSVHGVWSTVEDDKRRRDRLFRGLQMHRYYRLPQLVSADELLDSTEALTVIPWQLEKNILRDTRREDYLRAEEELTEWLESLTAARHAPEALSEQVERLVVTLLNSLKEVDNCGFMEALNRQISERITACTLRRELEELMKELLDCFSKGEGSPETENILIQKALRVINSRLNETISLEDTAEQIAVSPEHLSRLFKEETGQGFNSYINRKKVDRAREMLLKENLSIHQIALRLGYSSSRYFARVFRKVTGMSPKEFREFRQG